MSNLQRKLNELVVPTGPVPFGGQRATGVADPTLVQDAATKNYTDTGLLPKAPLASPALTGVPVVPTAALNTNTAQAASTAYVVGQLASTLPIVPALNGSAGSATTFARGDHAHPSNVVIVGAGATGSLGGVNFMLNASDPLTLTTSVAMTGMVTCFLVGQTAGNSFNAWNTGGLVIQRGSVWAGATSHGIGIDSASYSCKIMGILTGNGHTFLIGGSSSGANASINITMVS